MQQVHLSIRVNTKPRDRAQNKTKHKEPKVMIENKKKNSMKATPLSVTHQLMSQLPPQEVLMEHSDPPSRAPLIE